MPVRVYVRRWADDLPERVAVEPGLRVVHVTAGPADAAQGATSPRSSTSFADGVAADLVGHEVSVLHANYWLSAVAAHRLKHELGLPLVSTFHTLARVKAETGDAEPGARARAEAEVIGCSDAICASNPVEAEPARGALRRRRRTASRSCPRASTTPSSRPVTGGVPARRSVSTTARWCCSWVASSR